MAIELETEDPKAVGQGTDIPAGKGTNTDVPSEDKNAEINQDPHEELRKLSADKLFDLVIDTRSEAKTRRHHERELEDQLKKHDDDKKLTDQMQLEKNQEWETAYTKLKEDTKDFESYKEFKQKHLEHCKEQVEELAKGLIKAEQELFELSSKNMTYDEQLIFMQKLLQNRATQTIVDKTQSMGRSNGDDISDKTEKPSLFGNPSGVMAQVMNTLKKAGQIH